MRHILLAIFLLGWAGPAWAAVAFGTNSTATYGSGTSTTTIAITISGTNRALVVGTASGYNAGGPGGTTVSSVSLDLGGTFSQITTQRNTADALTAFATVWCMPNPPTGSGTITVTWSTNVEHQAEAAIFVNTDQATPCSGGVGDGASGQPVTLTPASLTANDASYGICANDFGTPTGVTPSQLSLDATGSRTDVESGYATGTTGITFSGTGLWHLDHACVAVRIVAGGATAKLQTKTSNGKLFTITGGTGALQIK